MSYIIIIIIIKPNLFVIQNHVLFYSFVQSRVDVIILDKMFEKFVYVADQVTRTAQIAYAFPHQRVMVDFPFLFMAKIAEPILTQLFIKIIIGQDIIISRCSDLPHIVNKTRNYVVQDVNATIYTDFTFIQFNIQNIKDVT